MYAYLKREPFEGKPFPFRATIQKGAGELIVPHWHEHLEFNKVIEGRVNFTLDSISLTAERDDILFVKSGRIHSAKSDDGLFCSIKGMVFDKYFITNIIEGFETEHIYSLFIHSNDFEYRFSPSHPLWHELNRCMELSYTEYANRDICYEMSIKSNIYRLITELLRYYKTKNYTSGDYIKASNKLLRLRPVFEFIESNYENRIYIGTLSDLLCMNVDYFTRYFSEVTGKTPVEFINHMRINMALRLLIDTDFSVTRVSEKVGFCNINYFEKLFKKNIGLTPSEYKNKLIRRTGEDQG